MTNESKITREEALRELARYGIKGARIYLIDVIPLIEMVWADGLAQESEVQILDDYLRKHVAHINSLAKSDILTMDIARDFVAAFLRKRPDPELLSTLRSFLAPVRFSTSDKTLSDAVRKSLLAACIDIASSAKIDSPNELQKQFNFAEKRCFFEILESMEDRPESDIS